MIDSGKALNSATMAAVELSYGEMTTDEAGRIISKEVKRNMRKQNGYCLTCPRVPVKLYEIQRSRMNPLRSTKIPRVVPGECAGGKCLKCNPGRRVSPSLSTSELSQDSCTSDSVQSPRDVAHERLELRNRLNPLRWFGSENNKKLLPRPEQAPRKRRSSMQTATLYDDDSLRRRQGRVSAIGSPKSSELETSEASRRSRHRRSTMGGTSNHSVAPEPSSASRKHDRNHTLNYESGDDSPRKSPSPLYPTSSDGESPAKREAVENVQRRRRRHSIGGPSSVNPTSLTEEFIMRQQRLGTMAHRSVGDSRSRHHYSINPERSQRSPSEKRLEQYERIVNSRSCEMSPRGSHRRHSMGRPNHDIALAHSSSSREEVKSSQAMQNRSNCRRASITESSSSTDYGYEPTTSSNPSPEGRGRRRHSINGAAMTQNLSLESAYEARKKMRVRRSSVCGVAPNTRFQDSGQPDPRSRRRRYSMGMAPTGSKDPNVPAGASTQASRVTSNLSLRVLSEQGNQLPGDRMSDRTQPIPKHRGFSLGTIGESESNERDNGYDRPIQSPQSNAPSLESWIESSGSDLVHDRWESTSSRRLDSRSARFDQDSNLRELEIMVTGLKAASCPPVFAEALVVAMERHSMDTSAISLCLRTVANEFNDENFDSTVFVSMQGGEKVLESMAKFPDTKEIQRIGCKVLSILAVKQNNRTQLIASGSCEQIQKAVFRFMNDASLVVDAIAALRIFSTETSAQTTFEQLDISTTVVEAMNLNMEVPSIQRDGTAVVSNTAVNILEKKVSTVDPSALRVVVKALKSHACNEGVAEDACFALKNLSYNATNLKYLSQTLGEIDSTLQAIIDLHSIKSASDVLEKIHLTRAADESLEEKALHDIEAMVVRDNSDVVIDLIHLIEKYRWSRRLVVTCLSYMKALAIASDSHRSKLTANVTIRELRSIVDAFTTAEDMREELSIIKGFF